MTANRRHAYEYQNLNQTTTVNRLENSKNKLAHIPGSYGLPLIGKSLQAFTDFPALIKQHHDDYGEVSRIQIGPQRGLVVIGPENAKEIFLDKDRNFSTKLGYETQLGHFYNGGLLLRDYDEHRSQRRIFQVAFKREAMQSYAAQMNPIFSHAMTEWRTKQDILFFPEIKTTILHSATKVFTGISPGARDFDLMNQAFLDTVNGLISIVQKDIPIPWLKYRKGMNGKRYIHSFIDTLIVPKRYSDDKDLLATICRQRDENGKYFTHENITNHLSFLLFAAHDTTTALITHMVYQLAMHQQWQERVREECQALGKPEITYDDLDQLPELKKVIKETLRLHPSLLLLMRRTLRDCSIGGYQVPAGATIYLPVGYNQRLETFWENPNEFRPNRFDKSLQSTTQHPFQYTPFGGGVHKCIGMHFAEMQILCFMHQFLQHFRFSMPQGVNTKLRSFPLPKPTNNLPLELSRI